MKDPHNDTAKFGEASANELITLQVPNPAQMSKRGSIFLRMEDRSPTSPAFLMHQASGQFSDVWHHAGQQSSSKAEDNSRNSLQPGEDPFDEVKEQEDSSFDEHHA